MKRFSTRVLSFVIVLAMAVSMLAGFASAAAVEWPGTPTGYKSASDVRYVNYSGYIANWGARGENCTFLPSYAQNYYTGSYTYAALSANAGGTSQGNATSSALYSALKSMLKAKQTKETTYNGTRDLFCVTDCVNGNYNYISSFYSGMKLNGEWGTGWNREHTWPNSKGNDNQDNDIMMLRPTSNEENSDRGNDAYGESSGYYDPNKESSGALNLRGDCARIVLYCYVRWENQSYMWGKSGVMEDLDVLLKWMEEDPVDTWEMGRNDSVQSITGVRNVFIDYPELAWQLFGRDVPDGYVTPSGSMGGSETCNHVWNAGSVTTAASCTQPGVMTYTCTLCGRTKTESIPAAGHNFVGGVCTVCGASQGAVYALANTLNTGDEVILYNAGNSKAVPATMKGSYYLDSVDIAAVNGVISNPDASIVWKVTKNSDGTYTFKNGSDTLSINWDTSSSKTSLSLDGLNPKIAADVCSAANNSFYLRSATQTGKYGNIYLEWYANYTEFSAYDTTTARLTEKDFGFQFYVKGGSIAPTEPTTAPTEPTTAPTEPTTAPIEPTTAPSGDYVAIYYPKDSKVMTTESYLYNNKKTEMVAADATLSGGKLTTSATNVALFRMTTANGVTTFKTADGKYLEADGTNVQLVSAENDNTKFILEPNGSDYFIKCATATYNNNPQYIEVYSGYFTVYSKSATADASIYTFNFYPLGGGTAPTEPTTAPTEPTAAPTEPTTAPVEPTEAPDGSFVLSSSIKNGDQVVIYNPGHGM
ncbi:MAG: endonuclease, partial [Oscillospiraceae bacterium]|nr:endonuclease [Oscillospiraceae bacterium]